MYKHIHILLIEDNPGDTLLIKETLRATEFNSASLVMASTLKGALEHSAHGKEIALILLDLGLPDSDGMDTVRSIRKHFPDSALNILTGFNDKKTAIEALREGVQNYLVKGDFDSDELERAIRYSIERHRIITELKETNKELKESQKILRELSAHLQNIREEERTHISREVHDVLGQQVTGLKMDISWLSKKIGGGDAAVKIRFNDMMELADEMVKSIRKISSELRPSILDDLGLLPALEWQSAEFEKRTGIQCGFTAADSLPEIPKKNATGIFRIYQETLTNVARHSGATKVEAVIFSDNESIRLTISDNGKGLNADEMKSKKTLGILGMKERAAMMNGVLTLESPPEGGTLVTLSVLLNKQSELQ